MARNKKTHAFDIDDGESWINRTWRPTAAIVYLAICLFDFILAPAFMGFASTNISQIAATVKDLDPQIATAIISNRTPWQPLTLQGSGLFHVAFGAILGVAAWTRGAAQIERVRQHGNNTPYGMPPYPTYQPPQPNYGPLSPYESPHQNSYDSPPRPSHYDSPERPNHYDAPDEPDKY